jgi:uncharacterized protein (DUF58 family)
VSRTALALGLAVYAVAWAFGSTALYPVATGLVLAAALAWAWVRLASAPMRLRRRIGRGAHVEGGDVWITLEVERSSRVPPGSARVVERIGRLGERETILRRDGRLLRATYVLESLPRGRYAFEHAEAVLEDPFGLERAVVPLSAGGALVIYPRLVELGTLFSESGAQAQDGRRLLLQRPSGFDLHSVREYERGESLRKVHWRTTARRGQLMVKELEDAPRDEVAVLLDAETGVVGAGFDAQVRAAGSILRAYASRGRRAVLAVSSATPQVVRVSSLDGEWRAALEALAAAEPDGHRPIADWLAREGGPVAQALELVVVTSHVTARLADRLVQRAAARHPAALVWVDSASYAGRPRQEPALLRLQAAGLAVAVVRRGDDLAAALGGGTHGGLRRAHG